MGTKFSIAGNLNAKILHRDEDLPTEKEKSSSMLEEKQDVMSCQKENLPTGQLIQIKFQI